MLTNLISENRSAFIPGWLISDNSVIAFESIHHIQSLKVGDPALCAYKLDRSNDRVDLLVLEKDLIKWGFGMVWISRIMDCVSSAKYFVKGKFLDSFTPSRGQRQGDQLSPFLFAFVVAALSSLINKTIMDSRSQNLSEGSGKWRSYG